MVELCEKCKGKKRDVNGKPCDCVRKSMGQSVDTQPDILKRFNNFDLKK